MKKLIFLSIICFLCLNNLVHAQLFGLTSAGGDDDLGTIFQYNPSSNTLNVDYSLTTTSSGSLPCRSALVNPGNGKLYGTTYSGGEFNLGVIFEFNPTNGTYSKKIDFNDSLKGSNPIGSLFLYNGKFYGMTSKGGLFGNGVIYEWDFNTNTFTKKYDFQRSSGANPNGSFTAYKSTLYALAEQGGANGLGVIFSFNPTTNTYSKIYDFSLKTGAYPAGTLSLYNGKLYGTTQQGGKNNVGVIFQIDSLNTYQKRVDFTGEKNGLNPYSGSLTFTNGKFYGQTLGGGTDDYGTIFEWNIIADTISKKYEFSLATGAYPLGGLTLSNGKLYGLSYVGGSDSVGVIFEFDPSSNAYVKKADFNRTNGSFPFGNLTVLNSKLYGLSQQGGVNNKGVIFEYVIGSNTITKKVDLSFSPQGNTPQGSLIYLAGNFYGTAQRGGNYDKGVIFQWNANTKTYTKKYDFNDTLGAKPYGALTYFAGKLFGLTYKGGNFNKGVLFEYNPATNIYSALAHFNGTNGAHPFGSLSVYNGKLYGLTQQGGTDSVGVIFEFNPITKSLIKKKDLTFINGALPNGSLTLKNDIFYGLTEKGGTDSVGVLFQWNPITNIYTKKVDLSKATGCSPSGNLSLYNGKFYGLNFEGGANNAGVIFEWNDTTNTYTSKYNLSLTTGANPLGTMTLSNDKFYGLTHQGGANDIGVLFEFDPNTSTYSSKVDFNGNNGSYPRYTQLYENCVLPPSPTITNNANNQTICGGKKVTLSAQGTANGKLAWYTADKGGKRLGDGNSFQTPILGKNTTFYVQDSTCDASVRTPISVNVIELKVNLTKVSACKSYDYKGKALTKSGIYNDTISSIICDSIFSLELQILDDDNQVTQKGNTLTTKADSVDSYQWIDCNNANALIDGATKQIFSPTHVSNYAVIVSKKLCVDTSNCAFFDSTIAGIQDAFKGKYTLSPNPVTDGDVNLHFKTQSEKGVIIKVFDTNGKIYYNQAHNLDGTGSIQIKANTTQVLSRGVYFVSIQTASSVKMEKLIVE